MRSPNHSFLEKNLDTLRNIDPTSAEEIRCCVSWMDAIRIDSPSQEEKNIDEKTPDGQWLPIQHQGAPVYGASQFARRILMDIERGAWVVFVTGFGFGTVIRQAVRELNERYPSRAVGLVVLEPRIPLLRAAFEWEDLTELLRNPRCLFAFGNEALEHCEQIINENALYVFKSQRISFQIGCGAGSLQSHWIPSAVTRLRAYIEKKQAVFSQHFLAAQQKYQGSPSKLSSPKSIWAHLSSDPEAGNVTPIFTRWVLDGFQNHGWEPRLFEVEAPVFSSLFCAIRHFHEHPPDLIFNVNAASPRIARFADSYKLPRIVWLIDHPALQPYEKPYHPCDNVFSVSDTFVEPDLRERDIYRGVLHGGAAANLPKGRNLLHYQAPFTYVGSLPEAEGKLTTLPSAHREYIQRVSELFLQGSLTGYDLFDRAPPPKGYETILDHYSNIGDQSIERAREWAVLYWGYTLANSQKRRETVRFLLPYGLKVYGSESWRAALKEWDQEESYGGPVTSRQQLADVYASTAVNIMIDSVQPGSFINLRVFEVPVMGGFLLSEYTPALEDLFQDKKNAAWYHGEDDLLEKARFYIDSSPLRSRIQHTACDEILQKHTYTNRVTEILPRLKEE